MNSTKRLLLLTVAALWLAGLGPARGDARPLAETAEYRLVQVIGGPPDRHLNYPLGVAVDGADRVYVADEGNNRIQVFDAQGQFLGKWGSYGSADGQFSQPTAVAVDTAGRVYVAEEGNHRIQVFDAQGQFLGKWGSYGSADGQFSQPTAVAVDTAGRVYVAEEGNHRIQVFDAQGQFLGKWGSPGSADGQFISPSGVAVNGASRVYVADASADRIQVFDAQGNFLAKWGSRGSADGQLWVPLGVALDGAGRVYVADASNHRIQVFDAQGNFLAKWGSPGSADGQFDFPNGVALDGAGRVYVADAGNACIQVFARAATTTPVAAPTLNQPEAGSHLAALGATLSWTLPGGSTQYQLQVTPPNNDGPGLNLIRDAAGSYTIPPPVLGQGNYVMLPGMTYSWRVRATSKASFAAEDDPSWGPWSEPRTFRTPAPSSAGVTPLQPSTGNTVAAGSVTLQWANTATNIFYYEVQVSGDPSFNTDPATATSYVWHNLVHGGVTSPLNSWTTPQLPAGSTVYWQVRPRVQGDGTPVAWSQVFSFRTAVAVPTASASTME